MCLTRDEIGQSSETTELNRWLLGLKLSIGNKTNTASCHEMNFWNSQMVANIWHVLFLWPGGKSRQWTKFKSL